MTTALLPTTNLLKNANQPTRLLVMRHHNSLGAYLKSARQSQRITQSELTKAIGLGASVSVSRWEHGIDPIPPRHYRGLANALHIELDKIIALATQDNPEHVAEFHRLEKQLNVAVPSRTDAPMGVFSLRRDLRTGLKDLSTTYKRASEHELLEAAVEFFIACAKRAPLDGNLLPLIPIAGSSSSSPIIDHPLAGRPKAPIGAPHRKVGTARS